MELCLAYQFALAFIAALTHEFTSMARKEMYGATWPSDATELEIELSAIEKGGRWKGKSGQECGVGLFEHYMRTRKVMWPRRYRHDWTDLMYHNFIENDLTILAGCPSSQKTSHAVEFALISYLARPENTLVVLSTTTMDKLDIGVWAELLMLWKDAKKRHEDLTGNVVAYKRAITTDNVDEDEIRDYRRGILCRPTRSGGRWIGLGTLAGVKQDYVIYVCDELGFMDESFSSTWPHLFSNGDVNIIGSGNFKHDPDDQLSITAEPKGGWSNMPEPTQTTVWDTKFMGGKCVNLVGTDSPNFRAPEDQPEPYPKLIGRKYAARIANDYGKDSFQYYHLIKGVMKIGFAMSRVLTRQLCREHGAMEEPVWKDDHQTLLYALDPSYGGEDRCIGGPMKFGLDREGRHILAAMPYRVFPVSLQRTDLAVEDQIAETLAAELKTYGIQPENAFYDATGKGTLGAAFARKFGFRPPVAIDSGARCSKRPVREDLFVEENGEKRLKRCDEHYSKFVTEMWFAVRHIIEAGQFRGLLDDVMAEGCARIYYMVTGNRIEVEPKSDPKKKEDLKRRLGKSPDLFDCLVIGVEGARRLGFSIGKLGEGVVSETKEDDYFDREAKQYADAIQENLLVREAD